MLGSKDPRSYLAGLPLRWRVLVFDGRDQPYTVKYRKETVHFCETEDEARRFVRKQSSIRNGS
jgi:hypothetical protein